MLRATDHGRVGLRLAAAILAAAALSAVSATAATAQIFTVATTGDPNNGSCIATPNNCSLRQALNASSGITSNDVINMPAGLYDLSAIQGQLVLNKPTGTLELQATGATIDANDTQRLLDVLAGSELTIVGATLTNGRHSVANNAQGGAIRAQDADLTLISGAITSSDATATGANARGGAISKDGGSLTITNSTISGNAATGGGNASGGGIDNREGPMTITSSTISGNTATTTAGQSNAHGAGLNNESSSVDSPATITNSTISGNTATTANFNAQGGGVRNDGGITGTATVGITNSTVSGNKTIAVATNSQGGGLYTTGVAANLDSAITVTNSTISGNSATAVDNGMGGGAFNSASGGLTLLNATVSGNSASEHGGNVTHQGGGATITNSILAGGSSPAGPDCRALAGDPITSGGYNLIENATDCALGGDLTGNLLGQSALLQPLAANGGPTATQALGAGSPALDKIPAPNCPPPATDQRGVARPQGSACDIGAFEFVPVSPVIPDTALPVVSAVALKPSAFAPRTSGGSTFAAKKKKRRVARGTTVSYRLSEAANVRFTVERKAKGRKKGKRCVVKRKRGKRCTVYRVVPGNFTHAGKAGANSFKFSGRLNSRKLARGSYRLVSVATDAAGNRGKTVRKGFRIL